jgi:hypothetical protein
MDLLMFISEWAGLMTVLMLGAFALFTMVYAIFERGLPRTVGDGDA